MIRVYKDFHFDAAHFLPHVPEGHKCGRMHGHTYSLRVWCEGLLDKRGFIVDYAEIAAAVKPVLDVVDHRTLNDIPGLENPTTEILAQWLCDRIRLRLPELTAVELKESATTGCTYML